MKKLYVRIVCRLYGCMEEVNKLNFNFKFLMVCKMHARLAKLKI